MTAVVFTGPSISPDEVSAFLPRAIVLGPVACGDVYRVLRSRPTLIAIIDGYFDQRLSVWHKEIMWALSSGVPVWGAASMGALRATELAAYGMQGIGKIFEWFRDGVLEDDDEVALTHDPADHGYSASSEPMVNIRATLLRALEAKLISETTAAQLIAAGKCLFYAERRWNTLLHAVRDTATASELESLQRWLRAGNSVDQKRLDALELIERVRAEPGAGIGHAPNFTFEYTEAWHALRSRLDREP